MSMARIDRHVPDARASISGFTLVELMVTVAILVLLAGLAFPSYRTYTLRAHRAEATTNLIQTAQALQRCYSQNNFTYLNCLPGITAEGQSTTTLTQNQWYQVQYTVDKVSHFSLTATATGPQIADTKCKVFTVDSTGRQ